MKPILVTCYVNPDLDGVAGVVGYAEFLSKAGQQVEAGIIGEPHDEAKYILDQFGIQYPKHLEDTEDYERVILVDASELNGLEGKIESLKVIEIIDHRAVNEADKFPNAKIQIELVGAAATLVAEKFMVAKMEISKESAILIYGAIISNTLNFKATVTTDRDRKAAQWLNKTAQLSDSFWKELFTAKSDLSGGKLAERIKGDFAWFTLGGKKLGVAQIEMIGAKQLIAERESKILQVLGQLKAKMGLDLIFQSTIELEDESNYFTTSDDATKALLEKALSLQFTGNSAQRSGLIMRKQIVPLLKQELEK